MPNPVQAVKNAPVTALTTAESVTFFVLTFLAAHHVLGNIDVSAVAQTVAPFVALVLPIVFGAVKHALVSPYTKVKAALERDGLLSDADFARIEAMLVTKGVGVLALDGTLPAVVGIDPPDAANAGAPTV